jgi:hypothetical protein
MKSRFHACGNHVFLTPVTTETDHPNVKLLQANPGKGAAQASLAARAWLDSHVTNDPSSQQHSDLYADLYEIFGDAHDIQETS